MTDRAYVRISLDREDTVVDEATGKRVRIKTSGSIEKQKAQILRRAPAPVWYADESVSGSKIPFAKRPAGARLLADLQRGDRVLVTKIDRAARNVQDLLTLVKRVEAAGASIVFTEQDISTEGAMGRFMLTLLGAVAELEAAMIGERRRESLVNFRAEGRHAVGSAPYGLQSVPNPAGRGLVLRPHPEEAPRLREAVERLLVGEPQAALAEDLGIGPTGFSRLLRNERLAGVLDYGADGPRVDPDMAVFSFEEWDRLQSFIDKRPAKTWAASEDYGPALACGVCGERLYRQKAKNPAHTTYKCRRVLHGKGQPFEGQPSASVIARNADERVEEDFLASFGALPVTEEVVVESSAARAEAIAVARLRIEAAKRAQDEAEDDKEERAAFATYQAAKRALREAEAMPDETVVEYRETGETFAEVWQSADHAERVALLLRAGRWVVSPGRMPIAEKVRRDETITDYLAGQLD